MTDLERWKIVKQFTIFQIVLLISGYDPTDSDDFPFSRWTEEARHKTLPMLKALEQAIEDGTLPLHKTVRTEDGAIDFRFSLVHVKELKAWLTVVGVRDGYFIAPASAMEADEIEDHRGRYYAPKLAAAMAAWKAVTSDPDRLSGKSPKQALTLWLKENAERYSLLNKDQSPNLTGIEEVAKVANWQAAGGAPTTPQAEDKPKVERGRTRGKVNSKGEESSSVSNNDDDPLF